MFGAEIVLLIDVFPVAHIVNDNCRRGQGKQGCQVRGGADTGGLGEPRGAAG
jgi:hypothetical protein